MTQLWLDVAPGRSVVETLEHLPAGVSAWLDLLENVPLGHSAQPPFFVW